MKNVSLLITSFLLSFQLIAQNNCYSMEMNHSGVRIEDDSLSILSCAIQSYLPEGVVQGFKTISIANYTLDEYKQVADQERWKRQILSQLLNNHPYHLILWWSGNPSRPYQDLKVTFDFPLDDDFGNCFTSSSIGLIEAKLQMTIDSIKLTPNWNQPYTKIEKTLLAQLNKEILIIRNCCSESKRNECSLCHSPEEIQLLKNRIGVSPLHSKGDLTLLSYLNDEIEEPIQGLIVDYVNQKIAHGTIVVNLREEFLQYREAVNQTNPSLYITNDDYFCYQAGPEKNREDWSLINFTLKDSKIILEVEHNKASATISFIEYLIVKFPAVFGKLLSKVNLTHNELYPVEDQSIESFYTGTGAILLKQRQDGSSFPLTDIYLAALSSNETMIGTLYSFRIENKKYVATIEKNTNEYLGFFQEDILNDLKETTSVLTNLHPSLRNMEFTKSYSGYINPTYLNSRVIGLINSGNGVVSAFDWEDSSNIKATTGVEKKINIPSFASEYIDQEDYYWNYTDINSPNIIIFITNIDSSPYSKSDIVNGNDNWNMACVANLYDALEAVHEMYDKHGFNRLENIVVRQHGSSTHFNASAGSKDQLQGIEIRGYLGDEDNGTYFSTKDRKNIEAFVYLMKQLDHLEGPGSMYFYGCNLGNTLAIDNCSTDANCRDLFANSFLYAFSALVVSENIRHASFYMNTDYTGVHKDGDEEFVLMGWGLNSTSDEFLPSYWQKGTYGEVLKIETDFILYKSGDHEPIERNN